MANYIKHEIIPVITGGGGVLPRFWTLFKTPPCPQQRPSILLGGLPNAVKAAMLSTTRTICLFFLISTCLDVGGGSLLRGSPRGKVLGKLPGVVEIDGGRMQEGTDPENNKLLMGANPGSAAGPHDGMDEEKAKETEAKAMYPHMLTHALQKEIESAAAGRDQAKKGGIAPDGVLTDEMPDDVKGPDEPKNSPPPPPGKDALSNPFAKSSPPGVTPYNPGDAADQKAKEKKKVEEDAKEASDDANEIKEDMKDKEAEKKRAAEILDDVITKGTDPSAKDKNKPDSKNLASADKEEPKEVKAGSADKAKPKKTIAGSADKVKPKEIIAGSADKVKPKKTVTGSADKVKPKEIIAGSADKVKPKETKAGSADKVKPKETTAGSADKEPSQRGDSGSADSRTPKDGDLGIAGTKDGQKIAEKHKVKSKNDHSRKGDGAVEVGVTNTDAINNGAKNDATSTDDKRKGSSRNGPIVHNKEVSVMKLGVKVVEDTLGSVGTQEAFSPNYKNDNMYKYVEDQKYQHWDFNDDDSKGANDFDIESPPVRAPLRIVWRVIGGRKICIVKQSSCSLPLNRRLDEESVACSGVHLNGSVANESENRCKVALRNVDFHTDANRTKANNMAVENESEDGKVNDDINDNMDLFHST